MNVEFSPPTGELADEGKPEKVAICICGHPVTYHQAVIGCQAAISGRVEALGGGIGSSRCECSTPEQVAVVPFAEIQRFRQSPTVAHALKRAVASMSSAGLFEQIEWDTEKLICRLLRTGQCESGPLEPLYMDKWARQTIFVCRAHREFVLNQGMAFEKVSKYVRKDKRAEQLARLKEQVDNPEFQRRYAIESELQE